MFKFFNRMKKNEDESIIDKVSDRNLDTLQKNENISINSYDFDFTVLDFETANRYLNSVCSIGIVAVKNNEVVDTFYSLVNPQSTFNSINSEIHGITHKDIEDEPIFPDIFDEVVSLLKRSKYIFAHNAQFDMSVLHHLANKYNLVIDDFDYIDSINFTRPQTPGVGNSLSDKLEYFGLENKDAHNALEDSIATSKIIIASINKSRFKSVHSYISGYSSVKVRKYKDLKPSNELFMTRSKFENVKISELEISHDNDFDKNHHFYEKIVVITGTFVAYSKKEIMQHVIDNGGIIRSGVSGKTDILISGIQDKSIVGTDGLSSKQRKANELITNGTLIDIITEDILVQYLK